MEDTKIRLEKMTSREIASEAVMILMTEGYNVAKEKCKIHMEVVNARLKAKSDELNKTMGTHRKAVQIKTITDFKRFR